MKQVASAFCALVLLGFAIAAGCSGGDSGPASRAELAALAPAELTLKDIAATHLPALPDTVGKKSRVRSMHYWVLALTSFRDRRWQEALTQLGVARSFYAEVTEQEEDWFARFRNLEAACRYMLDPPGSVKEHGGALEAPRADALLDVHYEWLLALDALRVGDGEGALGRLRFVAGSEFPIALEARALLERLEKPKDAGGS